MTVYEYQGLAARTVNKELTNRDLREHALHGIAAECGEVHGLYQKVYQGHEIDYDHVKKEVGDLLWFIAELCTAYAWSMEDIAKQNIEKLKARYPEGFSVDNSLHRAQGDV